MAMVEKYDNTCSTGLGGNNHFLPEASSLETLLVLCVEGENKKVIRSVFKARWLNYPESVRK